MLSERCFRASLGGEDNCSLDFKNTETTALLEQDKANGRSNIHLTRQLSGPIDPI